LIKYIIQLFLLVFAGWASFQTIW